MSIDVPRSNRRQIVRAGVLGSVAAAAAGAAVVPTSAATAISGQCQPMTPESLPAQVPVVEGLLELPGGARIWYWDTGGDGEAVLLSHPASGSALMWGYQQPVLAAAGYRVIAFSRRGHYNSSPLPTGTATGRGSDDIEALLNHLGVDRAHMIGAALGGYFVTDYALRYPERVRSLLIVSSYMGITASDYIQGFVRLRPAPFNDMPHSFKELGPYYRAVNPAGSLEWESLSRQSLGGAANVRAQTSPALPWERLETLSVRTMLVAGDADLYQPPPLVQMVHEHLPAAEMITFDKVGHCANWERPGDFNKHALRFLRGVRTPRPICV